MNRIILLCMAVAVAVFGMHGCGGESSTSPADPADVLRKMRQQYEAGRYRLIEPYIAAERRVQLVDTLIAVDQVLVANRRLQSVVTEHYGPGAALVWDLGELEYHVGPFSRNAQIIRSEKRGQKATVVIQIAERIPLQDIHFVQNKEGGWQYLPDQPIEGMPAGLRRLARKMDELSETLQGGEVTQNQFEQRYRTEVLPLMDALGDSKDAGGSGEVDS
jgi:hypothetical protein